MHKIQNVFDTSCGRRCRGTQGRHHSWAMNTQNLRAQIYCIYKVIKVNVHTLINQIYQTLWMRFTILFMFLSVGVSSLLVQKHLIYTHMHTPLPTVLHFIHSSHINSRTTLFMIPQFMSACRQASPLGCLAPYLLCLMSLSPSTWALNETMVLSSNEQWVCQVLKGERDKWREGTRGCEDNRFLWWLTFQSGTSKKVWLSYCVLTDRQMNGGLGTGSVCGTEGNKHTMSNLHQGSRCVCVRRSISTCSPV